MWRKPRDCCSHGWVFHPCVPRVRGSARRVHVLVRWPPCSRRLESWFQPCRTCARGVGQPPPRATRRQVSLWPGTEAGQAARVYSLGARRVAVIWRLGGRRPAGYRDCGDSAPRPGLCSAAREGPGDWTYASGGGASASLDVCADRRSCDRGDRDAGGRRVQQVLRRAAVARALDGQMRRASAFPHAARGE
eukprot:1299323-Lingulodinium_polyedra.AAC.1